MDKLVKTNVDGLYKSKNAIVANDPKGLAAYKTRRKLFRNQVASQEKIDQLENDIKDIKQMLHTLMEKLA